MTERSYKRAERIECNSRSEEIALIKELLYLGYDVKTDGLYITITATPEGA